MTDFYIFKISAKIPILNSIYIAKNIFPMHTNIHDLKKAKTKAEKI